MHSIATQRKETAFTLVELLVSIAVLALLAGMLLPSLARPRHGTERIKCVSHLKNIGLGFRIFASDHQDRFPMQVPMLEGGTSELAQNGQAFPHFAALSNELSVPNCLVCPTDKGRKVAVNFSCLQRGNVSYFVGLGPPLQPQLLLAGDRNLTTNGQPVGSGLLKLTTNEVFGWTAAMHHQMGNVVMGDGSVQQLTAVRTTKVFQGAGQMTNWLAVP